jgi:hypothetical protein
MLEKREQSLAAPHGDDLFEEWRSCPDHPWSVFCQKCESTPRGFRLLVNWLKAHPIGRGSELPPNYHEFYDRTAVPAPIRSPITSRVVFPERDSTTRNRKVYSLEEIRSRLRTLASAMKGCGFSKRDILIVTTRLQAEAIPRFGEEIETDLDGLGPRSPEKRSRFFNDLLLAWCIRQADNEKAWRKSDFKKACLSSSLPRREILDLTYLPIESLTIIPDIRASLNETRKRLSSSLMSYRQRQARDKDSVIVDPDGKQEEAPPSEEWEQQWCSNFGLEKNSRMLSRQYLWSLVFIPLLTQLLVHVAGRKELNWKSDSPIVPDEVFKIASRLIHLRYPEHWPDKWQRVKNRYLYKRVR